MKFVLLESGEVLLLWFYAAAQHHLPGAAWMYHQHINVIGFHVVSQARNDATKKNTWDQHQIVSNLNTRGGLVHVLRNLKRKQMKSFDDWTRCFNLLMEMASWSDFVFGRFLVGGGFDIHNGGLIFSGTSWTYCENIFVLSLWSILALLIKTELFDSLWVANIWSFNCRSPNISGSYGIYPHHRCIYMSEFVQFSWNFREKPYSCSFKM